MDGWRDFTFDPLNYPLPEMQRFVRELHARQQRWVPIVDPGIKVRAEGERQRVRHSSSKNMQASPPAGISACL